MTVQRKLTGDRASIINHVCVNDLCTGCENQAPDQHADGIHLLCHGVDSAFNPGITNQTSIDGIGRVNREIAVTLDD